MTPRPQTPNDWLPLLAGYLDGELDEATARRVESWLANDPQAAEILHEQESVSPANAELWAAVEPELPDAETWESVQGAISRELALRRPQPKPQPVASPARWLFAAMGGVIAVSAAVIWMVIPAPEPEGIAQTVPVPPVTMIAAPPPRVVVEAAPLPHDPLAGFAVLPLAAARDVLIEAIQGDRSPHFVGFEALLPDGLNLAGPDDVRVEAIRHDPATGPAPRMLPGNPMIYAARR